MVNYISLNTADDNAKQRVVTAWNAAVSRYGNQEDADAFFNNAHKSLEFEGDDTQIPQQLALHSDKGLQAVLRYLNK